MSRPAESTRAALLDAASRLFAERGPDGVSLAEINSAARQKNTAAVHYHFRNRDGLLAALIEPHKQAIDAQRRERLDALTPEQARDLRALTRVLVLPLAEKLDGPTGRRFLRLQARLVPRQAPAHPASAELVARVHREVRKRLPLALARTRGELVQLMLFPALAERARREEEKASARRDRRAWVEALVDAVVGILAAPVGEEESRRRRLSERRNHVDGACRRGAEGRVPCPAGSAPDPDEACHEVAVTPRKVRSTA